MVLKDVKLSDGHTMPTLGLGVYLNSECANACNVALQNGYQMIDTARMYGNEKEVGVGLKESGVDRKKVFIISKVFDAEYGPEKTKAAIEDSIKKLNLDYCDLYLIHSPHGGKELRLATYKALLDAKAAGLIRSVGVSNYGAKHIEEIRNAKLELPVVNQVELHPFCQQRELVEYCKAHNIIVQAHTPLARGIMNQEAIQELAEKYGRDPAQIAIRWSLQKGLVPLPKSSQPEHIISNAQIYDFDIEGQDIAKLDALDKGKEGALSWNPVDIA